MTTTAATRSDETRERILRSATEVFGEKGFAKASTREIARRAQVNIASLHYHFGDKADLYRALFSRPSMQPTAETLGVSPEQASFEVIFRYLNRQFLNGISDGLFPRLLAREHMEPSGLLGENWVREVNQTHGLIATSLARELGGPSVDREVHRLAFALMGMVLIYDHGRPLVDLIAPDLLTEANWIEITLDRLTDYARALIVGERARRAASSSASAPTDP